MDIKKAFDTFDHNILLIPDVASVSVTGRLLHFMIFH